MKRLNLQISGVAVLAAILVLGAAAVGLAVRSQDGASGPSSSPSTLAPSTEARVLPASDASGRDLGRLPRYPGSVRTAFETRQDGRYRVSTVRYLADARIDDARIFYQNVIAEHGWQRADIAYESEEWTYVLVDGAIEAVVRIAVTGGLLQINLEVSRPVQPTTPEPKPQPTPAPPPAQPAPRPPDDDGDDGGGGWTDDESNTDDDEGSDD